MRVSLPHGREQETKGAEHAEDEKPGVGLHEGLDGLTSHHPADEGCGGDHAEQHTVHLSHEGSSHLERRVISQTNAYLASPLIGKITTAPLESSG